MFTKRELRLLDDLLPESDEGKRRRRVMIRQFSRKITSKQNMDKDIEVDDPDRAKIDKELAKAALRKRAAELGLELDTLTFK